MGSWGGNTKNIRRTKKVKGRERRKMKVEKGKNRCIGRGGGRTK